MARYLPLPGLNDAARKASDPEVMKILEEVLGGSTEAPSDSMKSTSPETPAKTPSDWDSAS